jgi:hypothetical protein
VGRRPLDRLEDVRRRGLRRRSGGGADYASFQTSLANLDAAQRSGEAETFKDALAAFAQSYDTPWADKAAAEALARFNHEDALAAAEAAKKIAVADEDRKLAQAQASAQQDKSNAEAQADADRIGGEAQAELDRATGLKAAVALNPDEASVDTPEERLPAGLVRVELPERITATAESSYFGSPIDEQSGAPAASPWQAQAACRPPPLCKTVRSLRRAS